MNPITSFVMAHPIGFLIGFGYNAICMFNAMVPPGVDGGGFYGWSYRYGHLLVSSPVAAGIVARVSNLPISQAAAATTTTTAVVQSTTVEETKK